MKIAVVRNRNNEGVVARFGVPTAEKYGRAAVQGVLDALRAAGHETIVLEGDGTLFARLAEFMPADPATGLPTGMVFNMAYGVQGECRYVHVPGLLEMAGVPYTGSSPRGHAACAASSPPGSTASKPRDASPATPAGRPAPPKRPR